MSNVWTDELHGRKGREIPKGKIQPVTRKQLERIVGRTPEVLVQVSKSEAKGKDGKTIYPSPRTAEGLSGLLNYLGRITDKEKDDLEVTDDLGLSFTGRGELKEAVQDWKMPDESNRREVLHVVMGMPKFCSDGKTPTDVAGVERAATATAEKLFKGYRFIIAHHRDSDGGHPHAHVLVRMEHMNGGKRLNPRRNDLERYRNTYAAELRKNGLQANATSAVQRLSRNRNVPQSVAQMHKKRGTQPNRTAKISPLLVKQADYMTTLADAIESKGDADLASKTRRYVSAQMSGDNLTTRESAAMRFSEQQHAETHQQDHTHSQ